MIPKEFQETSQAHRLLSALEPRHLNKLLPLAEGKKYSRDQIIFHEGDKSSYLYLIVSGSVALETVAPGHMVRVQMLHAGEAMGWSALTEGGRTHFQARATAPVTVIAFPGPALREACDKDPDLGYALMKQLLALLADRLDAARMQLIDMYGARPGAVRA